MVICAPIGGLNNRIRCLISAMRADEDIKLVWPYKNHTQWLWCKFSDLFDNPYEEFFYLEECKLKYPNLDLYSDYKFIPLKNEIDINHFDKKHLDNWQEEIPKNLKNSYLKAAARLKPIKYIQDSVDNYKRLFDKDTISVSIRSFLDCDKNKNSMGQYFDISRLFHILDNIKEKRFFITCDHQETFNKVLDRYGDRVLYTPKRTFFGDFQSTEGIQDSVIDLYLGGLNDLLISSMGSSYCEMQWWLGGGHAKTKVINLHTNQ